MRRTMRMVLMSAVAAILGACAAIPGREPPQVTVAGIEELPGQGLELRMLVKLRVQNPNDSPLEYDGVYVKLDVLDSTLATGVSGERGSVPRFGEAVIGVPVTISVLRVALNSLRFLDGKPIEKVNYRMEGKLDGVGFGSTRFHATGELKLPD